VEERPEKGTHEQERKTGMVWQESEQLGPYRLQEQVSQ
jgi:hypothetical protein